MTPSVSGYVLAGGLSSRMGTDKALLRLGGVTLLEIALEKVRAVCGDAAILCGSAERAAQLASYGRCVVDRVQQAGPLGALEAALLDAEHEWLLLVPVDMPKLPVSALRDLLAARLGAPTVRCFEAEGRLQPLPVLIHRSALAGVTRALEAGERRLMPFFKHFSELSGERFDVVICGGDWFVNVNTPEDFEAMEGSTGRPDKC